MRETDYCRTEKQSICSVIALSFFLPTYSRSTKLARQKKVQKLYTITLEYASGLFRTVQVRASDREVAEKRALKRNPSAIGIKRDA